MVSEFCSVRKERERRYMKEKPKFQNVVAIAGRSRINFTVICATFRIVNAEVKSNTWKRKTI